MQAKTVLGLTAALFIFLCLSSVAVGNLGVGVKPGDWIEYNVTYTGKPTAGHDITWARMEVQNVSGSTINVTITSRFSNNTELTSNSTLNFATGQLIDNFIIPANLTAAEKFYSKTQGNITISEVEQRAYAGAVRNVLATTVGNNSYVWDQVTGVSVEGTSEDTGFSMHTVVNDTNMWQPDVKPSGTIIWVWVTVAAVVVIVVAVGAVVYWKRRSNKH